MDLFTKYVPKDDFEESDLAYINQAIKLYGDSLFDRNPAMHFSASAMIFNKTMTKTVMIYHKLYNSWGWVGGHMDLETDFKKVALKEASEETGLKALTFLFDQPVSIEVLPVWFHRKHQKAISSHLHLNVSYILIADETEVLIKNDQETNGVKWIFVDELEKYVTEPDMIPVYKKIIERGQNYEKHNII